MRIQISISADTVETRLLAHFNSLSKADKKKFLRPDLWNGIAAWFYGDMMGMSLSASKPYKVTSARFAEFVEHLQIIKQISPPEKLGTLYRLNFSKSKTGVQVSFKQKKSIESWARSVEGVAGFLTSTAMDEYNLAEQASKYRILVLKKADEYILATHSSIEIFQKAFAKNLPYMLQSAGLNDDSHLTKERFSGYRRMFVPYKRGRHEFQDYAVQEECMVYAPKTIKVDSYAFDNIDPRILKDRSALKKHLASIIRKGN
jgi:hypothetical protein